MIETGTTSYTAHVEWDTTQGLQQVFPCWCGQIHRGPYAVYDHGHHHCQHRDPLVRLDTGYYICGECGLTFQLEGHG